MASASGCRRGTAWLRMDSQANLMLIVGVYDSKQGVTTACGLVEERLLRTTLRSCVVRTDATRGSRRQLRSRPHLARRRCGGQSADLKRLSARFHRAGCEQPLADALVDNYNGGRRSSPYPPLHRRCIALIECAGSDIRRSDRGRHRTGAVRIKQPARRSLGRRAAPLPRRP